MSAPVAALVEPLLQGLVGLLLLGSAAGVLLAAIGMTRLPDMFQRMHAPALAATFATWSVALASVLHFSLLGEGIELYAVLVVVLLAITVPITTIVLTRAALFRRRQAGDATMPRALSPPAEPPLQATDTPPPATE